MRVSSGSEIGREYRILAAIVFTGFAARAACIWLARPEFVGWFNHSYYYWVQVRGLLQSGQLPYADLPFLFVVYGGVGRLLQIVGLAMEPAIVNTTRAIMSIVPALIAVPVYGIVKGTRQGRPLAFRQWVIVALSAFLPLTLVHMPELLQKNCLGLLLLGGLIFSTYRLLQSRSMGALVACLALFVLIAVTHIGTLAVTLLFFLSIALAVFVERGNPRQLTGWLILVLACSGVGLTAVFLLDAGAFERVLLYARSSLPDSLLGNLFAAEPQVRRSMSLLGILIPLAAFGTLLWVRRRRRTALQTPDQLFWLGNTLFAYMLVLPVFDLDLIPRFVLFLPLPALVILNYYIGFHERGRRAIVLIGLASAGVVAMLFGEVMNLIYRAPHKEAIHRELVNLKEQHDLTENDFVLTRYGVNPICNWFLGAKAGLITALHKDDFQSHDRVFVLNPNRGSMAPGRARRGDAKDAYLLTRSNVPIPADARPLVQTEHLTFYELPVPPRSWLFDDDGNWTGSAGDTTP